MKVIRLPFQLASLAERRAAAAAPIIEYRGRIQSMASAMGTSAANLGDQFYGGSLTQDTEWMRALGLNPLEAMQMSVNFGIAGKNNADQRKIVKALAMLNPRMGNIDTPGLGFLQNGQAESSATTAARYGYIEPTGKGIEQYGKFLSDMLTPAIAKGMDTSSLARSFDAAMSMMTRGNNVAPTKEAIGAYFSGFMGTAGGRTGEAAVSFLQAESAAMGQVGKDVPHTIAEATSPLANVKSKEQLKAFLSAYPGAYDNIMNDPGMAMIVNQLPYMDDLQRNIQLSQIINQAAPQARFDVMRNNAVTNSAPGAGGREFVAANLLGRPVSSVYTREIQAAADRNHIPASLLNALIMRESSGDPRKTSPKGAKGLTQIMDTTAQEMGVAPGMVFDPLTNMNAGAGYLYKQYQRFGNWREALEAYNTGPGRADAIRSGNVSSSVKAYADEIIQASGIESNKTPVINAAVKDFHAKMSDALGVRAAGGEAGLFASDLGAQETAAVENSITAVINALKNFADTLQSQSVNAVTSKSQSAGAYMRGGSPPLTGR
jgi:soluble lytic murein transglycosylase-like protein